VIAGASAPARADGDQVWSLAQRFSTGVSVVTSGAGDAVRGSTVSAFCLVSREPALVSVCLRRGSGLLELIRRHRCFTVNVLSGEQALLARHFASRHRGTGHSQFDGIGWTPGEAGEPRLTGTLCWLHCRPAASVAAGDHELILARVLAMAPGTGRTPLLYFAGALHPGDIEIEDENR
jgi:flavin reductase (DIM6/NTAB) family NADH-FMN oxidoreductase RutF